MWQRIKNCIHGNELVYAGPFSRSVVSYGGYSDIKNWYIYIYIYIWFTKAIFKLHDGKERMMMTSLFIEDYVTK